jgi:hypothetical protein
MFSFNFSSNNRNSHTENGISFNNDFFSTNIRFNEDLNRNLNNLDIVLDGFNTNLETVVNQSFSNFYSQNNNNNQDNQDNHQDNQDNNQDNQLNILENISFKLYDDTFNEKSCSICLNNFIMNDELYLLQCEHLFHKKCLLKWFKKKQTCPICRHDIKKKIEIIIPEEPEENDLCAIRLCIRYNDIKHIRRFRNKEKLEILFYWISKKKNKKINKLYCRYPYKELDLKKTFEEQEIFNNTIIYSE